MLSSMELRRKPHSGRKCRGSVKTQNLSLFARKGMFARGTLAGFPLLFNQTRRRRAICIANRKAPKGKDDLFCKSPFPFGAADGSRTHLCSLGSCRSTDELQPHVHCIIAWHAAKCNRKMSKYAADFLPYRREAFCGKRRSAGRKNLPCRKSGTGQDQRCRNSSGSMTSPSFSTEKWRWGLWPDSALAVEPTAPMICPADTVSPASTVGWACRFAYRV